MKAVYERPRVTIEMFAARNSVADSCVNFNSVFDCMRGPNTDTVNVITEATGCGNKAIYISGVNTAVNLDPKGGDPWNPSYDHSNFDKNITWTENTTYTVNNKTDNTTLTATSSSALGLLYICATEGWDHNSSFGTGDWTVSDGIAFHSGSSCTHAQIKFVYSNNVTSVNKS